MCTLSSDGCTQTTRTPLRLLHFLGLADRPRTLTAKLSDVLFAHFTVCQEQGHPDSNRFTSNRPWAAKSGTKSWNT